MPAALFAHKVWLAVSKGFVFWGNFCTSFCCIQLEMCYQFHGNTNWRIMQKGYYYYCKHNITYMFFFLFLLCQCYDNMSAKIFIPHLGWEKIQHILPLRLLKFWAFCSNCSWMSLYDNIKFHRKSCRVQHFRPPPRQLCATTENTWGGKSQRSNMFFRFEGRLFDTFNQPEPIATTKQPSVPLGNQSNIW